MAVNTTTMVPLGPHRIYSSDDGQMKFMFVDITLQASVTYDSTLRVDMTNFKKLYTFNMAATAGEVGKEVKIKQIVFLTPITYAAAGTGQVKAAWRGMKQFQILLSIIGTNGNTATTGPKDEAELGAVSSGSPAGHVHAIVYF
jgi:hypothetical protein